MRIIALYHPKSEHGGKVEDYARDYKIRHRDEDKEIELVSLETKAGANMAELYDVTSYPALLAIQNDGQLQKVWQEANLPLMNEVDYYFHD